MPSESVRPSSPELPLSWEGEGENFPNWGRLGIAPPSFPESESQMTDQQKTLMPIFECSEGPDLEPILSLHRRNDGYVTFHRQQSGDWQNLFSVKASDLDGYFPQMSPLLERDAYFSINAFWKPGYKVSPHSPEGTELKHAHRDRKSVRWLTACFADLDCYNLGLSVGETVGLVIDAQDRKEIPPASMIVRSGRGVWVFWFLVDKKAPERPQAAFNDRVELWHHVQREIGTRLFRLGADAASRDVARVTRVPGSINSKTEGNDRVDYWFQANSLGQRFSYTLDDLAEIVGAKRRKVESETSKVVDALSERGRKGQAGRWLKARADFENLWAQRGTWSEGTRNGALMVFLAILRSQRISEGTIRVEAERLVADFDQPKGREFTRLQFEETWKKTKGFKFGGLTNQYIGDRLRITAAEAEHLSVFPPAGGNDDDDEQSQLTKSELRDRRRVMLKDLIRQGKPPTLDALRDWLEERGHIVVNETIASDLRALGIDNPRAKRKRRKKRQPKLF